MTEVLAVVPARGGSKGIPGKNIRPLGGLPLIAHSIRAGLAAKSVTRLIVSTDSDEIAAAAREFGAEVPFLRPSELARDLTPDLPLFEHALEWLRKKEDYRPELVVQLRPTSPFRPKSLIDDSVAKLLDCPEADSLRGVAAAGHTPYKMWRDGKGGFLEPLLTADLKESYNMPRQLLPVVYWHTGHIDVIRTTTIVDKKSLTGDRILPILIAGEYCVDIDTPEDWEYAEWLSSRGKLEAFSPRA